MTEKKRIGSIWLSFGMFFILYALISFAKKDQSLLFLSLYPYSYGISIFLLIKNGFPKEKKLIGPLIFAILDLISSMFNFNLFSFISAGLVFLSACAVLSTFEKVTGDSFHTVRRDRRYDPVHSIVIGIIVGIVWGTINYFLMKGSNEQVGANAIKAIIVAFSPATFEEISCRLIFYAFCVYFMKGFPTTKWEIFTCYFLMIVPHVLVHQLFLLNPNILESFISVLLYVAVFGLIFAILQRKRDLLSAMISHGLVDVIRFMIFGLPF